MPKKKRSTFGSAVASAAQKAAAAIRKAKWRANRAEQQTEEERVLDAKRKAQVRADKTPEEIEQERVLNSQRMTQSRSLRTAEEIEQERVSNAQIKSQSRANRTEEEILQERVSNAQIKSQSRADRTSWEAEQDRYYDVLRKAQAKNHRSLEQAEQEKAANARCQALKRSSQSHEETLNERAIASSRMNRRRLLETPEEQQRQRIANTASHQQKRASQWNEQLNSAFQYNPEIAYDTHKSVTIGTMSKVCKHCKALTWPDERNGLCCAEGKVAIPHLEEPPEQLKHFLSQRKCVKDSRKYNSCFQMTSFGASKVISEPGYMPTYKVQGQVYHQVGSLLPLEGEEPKFLQMYFIGDAEEQAVRRSKVIPNTDKGVIVDLQDMLHSHNIYVQSFKSALEKHVPNDDRKIVIRGDRTPVGEHARRWNAPEVEEVAVLMSNDEAGKRDIVLEWRNGKLERIHELHKAYDALQYPLIFWRGEDGYTIGIPRIDPATGLPSTKGKTKTSAMDFYSYRLMVREGSSNHLFMYGPLFLQFLVDMYAKIESDRLMYIRTHQDQLRAEEYGHLRDAVANDKNPEDIGKILILPSSFVGSPRHMHQYTLDAMTYVRKHGKPCLFITFTCNPNWAEIKEALFPGQEPTDRPDIVARVFHLKVRKLVNLLTKGHIFGEDCCHMYTIEWQKRGLPHAHMLLWLKEKIQPAQVDSIISAEIPVPEADPILHQIVMKNMVHGPCGLINPRAPCMKDKKCTKDFPKEFQKETQTNDSGYPLYRRRSPEDGGCKSSVLLRGNEVQVDNRFIVPYCPVLSRTFNAHINVEFCSSVKSIKYICKYINKGSDMAIYQVSKDGESSTDDKPLKIDEISFFQLGRFLCSGQASWRMFGFEIHDRSPAVYHLQVHLKDEQIVIFNTSNGRAQAESPRNTSLLAFFELCRVDEFARTLLYADVPRFFVMEKNKKFKRRKRGVPVEGHPGIFEDDTLGRVYTVHPSNIQRFCLRMLLHVVPGPTSYDDLKMFEGQLCDSFQAACQLRGLMENDAHLDSTLREASHCQIPSRIRDLFVIMLVNCTIGSPQELWNKHKESMSEDILRRAQRMNPGWDISKRMGEVFNHALIIIEDKLNMICGKKLTDVNMQSPERDGANTINSAILRETSYDLDSIDRYVEANEEKLVDDQKAALTYVLQLLNDGNGGIAFLDSPGGTGKTFLLNLLLGKVRQKGDIALAVASSGIAATLFPGGRTAHSAFKLPIDLGRTQNPTCNISKDSGAAEVLRRCKLVIWDECTMSHKAAFEAVDRTLQDIRGDKRPFGGLLFVLSGDFRQTLPVITRGTPADEIFACIKHSYLWDHVVKLQLSTNMRVHIYGDQDAGSFANTLLQIGNGAIPASLEDGQIALPGDSCTVVSNTEHLISSIYPNISQNHVRMQWLCERAILAPKNDMVDFINQKILKDIPSEEKTYRSNDRTQSDEDALQFPTEFLNSLNPPGMPSHVLTLKKGAPVILLRNLDPPRLCNGTRLQIKQLLPHVIEATVLTGQAAGEHVFIPRIPIINEEMGFSFKRVQYPLKLCFAMTINKAQGQSLKYAGLHLENPCFSHGQLYVGCSRVGSSKGLFVLAPNGKTVNVVYPQVL